MKISTYLSAFLCLVVFACSTYMMSVDAQVTSASDCETYSVEELSDLVDEHNANSISTDCCDLTCGGNCTSDGWIYINGVWIQADCEKACTATALVSLGIDDPNCWSEVIDFRAQSSTLGIEMNREKMSKITLTSVKGEGAFEFPAYVKVELYANLMFTGMPVMRNEEPIRLQSTEPVYSWPSPKEVVYNLTEPVSFISDDGEDVATYHKATVRMKYIEQPLASR